MAGWFGTDCLANGSESIRKSIEDCARVFA